MPSLVRKFLVFAAVDGLILQPLAQKGQRSPANSTKIAFADCAVSAASKDEVCDENNKLAFESFGIVGQWLGLPIEGILLLEYDPSFLFDPHLLHFSTLADSFHCRSLDSSQFLVLSLDYTPPAGCTDPGKANLSVH